MSAATASVVVVNPRAGAGRASRLWPDYESRLRAILGPFTAVVTAARGDATARVRAAVQAGARRIVVIGGDGTLNEAVNGLFDAGGVPIDPEVGFGFVPCGTGADFARTVGLVAGGDAAAAAFAALRDGRERRIDVGRARFGGGVRMFVNVAGCGLAGDVVRVADRMSALRRLGPRPLFLAATLAALARYRPCPVRVTIDGAVTEIDDLATLAVANGRCFGGGMQVAPDAQPDDGRLDVVVVRGARQPLSLLLRLPRVYDGSHVHLQIVSIVRARRVDVEPLGAGVATLDLDGESPGAIPVSFDVLPAALRLIA